MAKPNRDELLREGTRQLEEWGAQDSAQAADLEPLVGRSEAADIAIAHRLGGQEGAGAVQLLQRLERGTSRHTRKEAKRSLFRLEQRGVAIPHTAADVTTAPVLATPIEGYLSAVDGQGDQLVWLVKPRAGGVGHFFAVINDPAGLRDVQFNPTTRKALREIRKELEAKHEIMLVAADWHYCDYLVHRAFAWARERRTHMQGDYPAARAQISRQPAPEQSPPLIFAHVDAESVRQDPAALARCGELLNEKEFRTWFFPPEQMRPYLDELASIKESPLVLSPLQQKERSEACVGRALSELFSGEMRGSYVRRLQEMAYYLQATRRPERAREAVAAALALAEGGSGGSGVPFCEALVQTSLAAWLRVEQREEEERARSSLVLTPQQAAQRQRK